jgi:hypothetical protein
MKIKFFYYSLTAVIATLCAITVTAMMLYPPNAQPIAMIMKIINTDVQRRSPGKEWQKAKRGDQLASKDNLKTGANAFAVVKFNDNTLLKVRPNSEITISGEIAGNVFSKSVELNRGGTDFDVNKQEKEKFEFSTPTSVASIRGTNGRFLTNPDSSDYLFINHGLASLLNLLSQKSTEVGNGQVGISYHDGRIEVRVMTKEEQSELQDSGTLRESGGPQNFEMDFKDNQEQNHKLKIEVQPKK